MPIRVTCPECDTKFKADDDRAGKRAACPECGERVPVPDAEGDPAPAKPATARPMATARPVAKPVAKPVAPKPKDEDEVLDAVLEDDDAPKSKRRRDDDEDEEKPRAKKRRDEDEDDDDAPKKRRRRDDDDADEKPKKKGGAGMIVGIILGVLLLVCGGGGAAVYFFIIKPIGDTAKKIGDAFTAAVDESKRDSSAGKLTAANVAKVQKGWTLAQCQEVFGKGKTATELETSLTLTNLPTSGRVRPLWEAKAKAGLVHHWDSLGDMVSVAFDADPSAGGKVAAVAADISGKGTNPIILGGFTPNPPDEPLPSLTADALVQKAGTLEGKQVIVSGKVKVMSEAEGVIDLTTTEPKGVRLSLNSQKWTKGKCKAGDVVWVTGKVIGEIGGFVTLHACEVTSVIPSAGPGPGPGPGPTPVDALTADQLSDKAADHAAKVVTMSGTVLAAVNEADGAGLVEFVTAPGKTAVRAAFDSATWKRGQIKPGDKLAVKGTVGVEADCVLVSKAVLVNQMSTPPAKPLATLTADGMADEIVVYNAQLIQVSGTAASTGDTPGGGGWVDFVMSGKRKTVRVSFDAANWTAGKIKAGDTLSAKGKAGYGAGNVIEVSKSELVAHKAGTAPAGDALTVAQVIDQYDTLKGKVVTVQGKMEFKEEDINRTRGVVAFELVKGAKMSVRAALEKGNWRANFLEDGDTLTVKGKVTEKPLGPDGVGGKMIVLEDCELLKRTTKDGKGVPIPGKADTKPTDAIAVTSDDLLADYIKDADAAAAKYKDKLVRITGEVKSTTNLTVVFADKTDKEVTYKVSVFVAADGRAAISGLKAGDKVTLTGKVATLSAVSPATKTRTLRVSDGKIEK